ncbi:lytic transglycosylase domain-containing protein [Pleomorphomonas koreensis]|uniref:lytic transglycosylase domain-containing protein n=1 Tax=Pleomorphomonas koreensis TaxID=257440 RepID=UPI00040BF9EF|nr:lytic transglycosylase domain-containing protein [Pleomorphomonas koreensis]
MRRVVLLLLSGLSFVCVFPVSTSAEPSTVSRPSQRDVFGEHIAEAAQRFELPATWIRAVMRTESDGDPRATSPKGAMGLMQIMPETWAELRIRYRLGDDAYDPHDNVIAGAAYIRELFDRYGSPGWIAAYNAGPGRYEASLKGRLLPAETRTYVDAVAPNLDGDGDAGATIIAAADPFAWISASLFIVQPDRKPVVDSAPAGRLPNDALATSTMRDISAIVPQSGDLFIARAAGGAGR